MWWQFHVSACITWNSHHLNTILNNQFRNSHEAVTTLIQSWTVNKNTHMKLSPPEYNPGFKWELALTIQDCIKVVTVSSECFYWLFRIVLRWWEFHVSSCIDCSGLYHWHETVTTLIQSWTVNKNTHMKLSPPEYNPEQSITTVTWCLYWLFRIILRWWEFHVSVFIDCSGLYWGGESFMWLL
jgi:hypothetical protein